MGEEITLVVGLEGAEGVDDAPVVMLVEWAKERMLIAF